MTIIIGARLDDGSKIMLADGNLVRSNDTLTANDHVKVFRVETTLRERAALLGLAGSPCDALLFRDALQRVLNMVDPDPEQLFYALRNVFDGQKCDSAAAIWFPVNGDHVLVHVGSDFFPVLSRTHFATEGSGGVEAGAALVALAQSKSELPIDETLEEYRPSMKHVQIAYDVACHSDVFCGGTQTLMYV